MRQDWWQVERQYFATGWCLSGDLFLQKLAAAIPASAASGGF